MLTNKETRNIISWILTIGTLISAGLVLIGGILYLIQHGADNASKELLNPTTIYTSITSIWKAAVMLTPLGIIALGVVSLVLTQLLRVGTLIVYYFSIHDYWFTFISLFVFFMLIFGLLNKIAG